MFEKNIAIYIYSSKKGVRIIKLTWELFDLCFPVTFSVKCDRLRPICSLLIVWCAPNESKNSSKLNSYQSKTFPITLHTANMPSFPWHPLSGKSYKLKIHEDWNSLRVEISKYKIKVCLYKISKLYTYRYIWHITLEKVSALRTS